MQDGRKLAVMVEHDLAKWVRVRAIDDDSTVSDVADTALAAGRVAMEDRQLLELADRQGSTLAKTLAGVLEDYWGDRE